MYKVTLKARGQKFEYDCAQNVRHYAQLVTDLFRFQPGVLEADAECVR